MQFVVVAQTIKGGRAPAQLNGWPGRLLDHPLALAGIRVLLAAAVVAVAGATVAWLTGGRPSRDRQGSAVPRNRRRRAARPRR